MFNKNELILLSAYALEGRGINPGTQRNSNIKAVLDECTTGDYNHLLCTLMDNIDETYEDEYDEY